MTLLYSAIGTIMEQLMQIYIVILAYTVGDRNEKAKFPAPAEVSKPWSTSKRKFVKTRDTNKNSAKRLLTRPGFMHHRVSLMIPVCWKESSAMHRSGTCR